MLTLRQIEVARAVMVTGTIAGAARLLNVSAPGISRLMKYTEASLGIRLFDRRAGRLVPSEQARHVFEQINAVFDKVEDLRFVLERTQGGGGQELLIGSVPSISHVMVPRAIERVRAAYPHLVIDINILKLEEAIDYLLLGKGEVVAMSYRLDHPALTFEPLARGGLFCIVPLDHPLAARTSISADEIVRHPLIGIDPNDPYGRIMSDIFRARGLSYRITIRARFGSTVCSLVRAGLGIAVIDQFTIADDAFPGIRVLPIEEGPVFETWIAMKAGTALSMFAASFVRFLRQEMARPGQVALPGHASRQTVT
ncbi:LysR family transcriptional regulator [Methylobacterium currus]|uniref:LysR family transcriptional regulator n=1 Tax=Methylobacterium currus TaxID=2051553 RepID=A0A2R4WQ37_9HYPH|nr:LysR family transcriptional regulator [Methylobacterium currus]AWB23666.1 LysR family transcriptional regulator [Methylobacterium currus]UHC16664.1 LysR family transcriptional regulator [Methylobacterium currus]